MSSFPTSLSISYLYLHFPSLSISSFSLQLPARLQQIVTAWPTFVLASFPNYNFLRLLHSGCLCLVMLPWYVSVSLVAGVLLASSYGERLGEEERREPDSFAVGFKKLGMNDRSREGKNFPSFQFTFDVGCQEGVRTDGLDFTTLLPQIRDTIKYTTLTYTTRVLGLDYKGRANMTVDGHACMVWADYEYYANVGEHNYCRSPGGSGGFVGVWCITSLNPPLWGFCPVPRCNHTQQILDEPADNALLPPIRSISWPAAKMPSSWTICSAFMLYDWPSPDVSELTVWTLVGWMQVTSPRESKLLINSTESLQRVYRERYPNIENSLAYKIKIVTAKEEFPGR